MKGIFLSTLISPQWKSSAQREALEALREALL